MRMHVMEDRLVCGDSGLPHETRHWPGVESRAETILLCLSIDVTLAGATHVPNLYERG